MVDALIVSSRYCTDSSTDTCPCFYNAAAGSAPAPRAACRRPGRRLIRGLPQHYEGFADGLVVHARAWRACPLKGLLSRGPQDTDDVLPVVPSERDQLVEDSVLVG
jgi:hypothetical protein